jgi:ubiquinone/menaquinone biosynthesis C-methylase UbiE
MKRSPAEVYVCPLTHAPLQFRNDRELLAPSGAVYTIQDGVPDFISEGMLSESEAATQKEYQHVADQIYDVAVDWQFASFYETEDAVRESMVDLLRIETLNRNPKVLEIGCGTGRDSFRIARRIRAGDFFAQDLSSNMVHKTQRRLEQDCQQLGLTCDVYYFVSSGTYLPFPDRYFDAVFHFGGFNNFADQKKSMVEIARIVRTGGRVVIGDESLPPWLEGTEFGEIVTTNNSLFRNKVPLDSLPSNAREVVVRWVIGSCFYLIDFTVGEGTPPLNLDLPHEGWRGGTMRTRYFGRLEGVTSEAKQMAIEAARRSGLSLHQWLDKVVRQAATSGTE